MTTTGVRLYVCQSVTGQKENKANKAQKTIYVCPSYIK